MKSLTESLSENPKENVLRIYYKSYRLKDSENSVVIVSCIDEDSNAIIKTEDIEIEQYRQKHFSYDIEFILKDENGLSYRYDSECSKKCERIVTVQQNDIVNIGLHFILKNVRPYAAPCSEA